MPTFFCAANAVLAMPTAAPKQSKSANWCPMIRTVSTFLKSVLSSDATTLDFIFVLFSTPLLSPPKNSKPFVECIAAWSPPLLSAMSSAILACSSFSANVAPPKPTPMDMVG